MGIKLKGSKNINKPQIGEALWIQASKARRTSTINLRRRRTHEEHEEREEQRISNKLIAKESL